MEITETLVADRLTKYYGSHLAIEAVSFSLKKGEIAGFLGPNGAGKSTALRILTGLMPASFGSAYVYGCSVARYPQKVHRHLGYLSETNPLPEDLRVEEYLRYRALLKGASRKASLQWVENVLELTDLRRTARKTLIGQLSKGYRQRVGIAEALLHTPKVLILDEPTVGLDPHQLIKFRELVSQLKGECTLLISSHLLPEIEAICDKAIIIHHGHIIANGSPHQLRKQFIKRRQYELCFLGDLALAQVQIAQVLGSIRWKLHPMATPMNQHFRLEVHSEKDHSEALIQALGKDPAIGLSACYAHEAHLEDIFLAATRRNWDQALLPSKSQSTLKTKD